MATATGTTTGRCFDHVQLKFALSDTSLDPSICLASFSHNDGKIEPNLDALSLLKTISREKPVAVLSICGPYRSGKSFFLSRMLGKNDAFKVSHEADPCTKGIWMSTIILECDDFVVVLLDTEGTNAAQVENENFFPTDVTKLLVLTTLLSSCIIYNTKGAPKQSELDEMSCFSHIAETIILREGASAADHLHEQNLRKFFPHFLWLVRDNDLNSNVNGRSVSLTEYVKERILVQSKRPVNLHRNEIVRTILALFPTLECRGTQRPGKPLEKDSKFLTEINETGKYLLNKIQPKTSFEHHIPITGSLLANLIEQYVHALNEPGAVPNLELSWIEAVKHHLIEKCQILIKEYSQDMQQRLQKRLPVEEGNLIDLQTQQPADTLAGIHQEIFKPKLVAIQNEAAHTLPSNKTEREKLLLNQFQRKIFHIQDERRIEGKLSYFFEENRKISQQHCEELLDKLYKEQQEIRLQKLKDDYFKEAIGPAKDKVYQRVTKTIPGPPLELRVDLNTVGKAKVTWSQPAINPEAAKQYEVHEQVAQQSETWKPHNTAIKEIELNVKPNTVYKLRIRGTNELRRGEFTEIKKFQTPPGKPDKPSMPRITIDSPTTATFRVQRLSKEKENGSPVTDVIVESCSIKSNSEFKIVHKENILSKKTLSEATPYVFQVDLTKHEASYSKEESFMYLIRLKNIAGESEPSDCVNVFTKEMIPGLVHFNTSKVEARKVAVSWKYPKYYPSSVQYFYVCFQSGHKTSEEIKCPEPTYLFCDLQPDTKYLFQVCGANDKNRGEWSTTEATTNPDCPCAPSRPSISVVSHDTAKLTVKKLTKQEENGKSVDTLIVEQVKTLDCVSGWQRISQKMVKPTRDGAAEESEIIQIDLKLESATTNDPTHYRVRMKNVIGLSQPSEEIQVTVNDLRPGPMKLESDQASIEPTSIRLHWKEPFNPASVKSYQIEKKVDSNHGWISLQDTKNLSYTDSNLQPSKPYTYRVTAVAFSAYFKQSTSNELLLYTDSDRPNKPLEKPTLCIKSSTEAILIMPSPDHETEANGSEIDTIIVEWRFDKRNWEKYREFDISNCSTETGLKLSLSIPDNCTNSISYRVKWKNLKGISEASSISDLRSEDFIPGPPSKVVHEPSSHSIAVSWEQPLVHSNAVKCYNIQYRKFNVPHLNWETNPPVLHPCCSCTVATLMPNTTYEYQICAVNKNNCSSTYYTAEVTTDTCLPDKPTNLRITVNSNRATISAQMPNEQDTGCPLLFICLYFYDDDLTNKKPKTEIISIENAICSDNEVIIKDIKIEEKTCFICISYKNRKGEGERSNLQEIGSQQLTPGRVSSFIAKEISFDRFTLFWTEPEEMARAAKSYEVMVQINGKWKLFNPHSLTEIEIPDLKPCTNYKARVNAVNGTIQGEFEEIEVCTTAGSPLKPHINSVVMKDNDPTTAFIAFNRLSKKEMRGSKVNLVILQWSQNTNKWEYACNWTFDDGDNEIIEEKFEIPEKLTTELQKDNFYFRIRMCSSNSNDSEPSSPYRMNLSDLCPGSVQNLRQLNITPNSVTLEWDKPKINPNATKTIVVHYYEATESTIDPIINEMVEVLVFDQPQIEVTSLPSNRAYLFEVCAKSDKCTGPPAKIACTTPEIFFPKPINLRAEFRQREAIKIRWSNPCQSDSEWPAYYVVYVDGAECRKTFGMSTVIKNLKSSTKYSVEVTSMNENGNCGPNSTARETFQTTMSNVKRIFSSLAAAVPTLGSGGVAVWTSTKQADDEKMIETDEEYNK